jgi:hypothetical protein
MPESKTPIGAEEADEMEEASDMNGELFRIRRDSSGGKSLVHG